MIVVNDNKSKVLYVRTNRRIKWQYAEYGGRYETVKEAIDSAKDHYGDQPFEYSVDDWDTGETITGLINWK